MSDRGQVLVCGEALIDLTPATCGAERGFVPRVGGSPFNVAIGLARLGTPAAFCGRVSTDPFGRMLRDALRRDGVDTTHTAVGDEPTPLAVVHLDDEGHAEYTFHFDGTAAAELRADDLPDPLPSPVTGVHVGSIALVLEPGASPVVDLLRRARAADLLTSLDPNVRARFIPDREAYAEALDDWVRNTTVLKASAEDLAWVWPDADPAGLARRWAAPDRLVVVTDGARGAFAALGEQEHEVPAHATTVVDTVGAGDAFTSGLLAALSEQGCDAPDRLGAADVPAAVRFASQVAALTCGRAGADPPRRDDVV